AFVFGAGNEHAIAHHDRAAVARAGELHFPADVFLFAPLHRHVLLVGKPIPQRSPKRRPIGGLAYVGERCESDDENGERAMHSANSFSGGRPAGHLLPHSTPKRPSWYRAADGKSPSAARSGAAGRRGSTRRRRWSTRRGFRRS